MQQNKDFLYAKVEEDGRLTLSPELASRYGIKPGDEVLFHDGPDGLYISRPTRFAKLYIEPTNQCNLDCRTCMRNQWDEPMGKMSGDVFSRIIKGLRDFPSPPTVFFGGFGEPLFHPEIVNMIAEAKALGASVELITNATLLTPGLSRELIKAGLNRLWVSLDGATRKAILTFVWVLPCPRCWKIWRVSVRLSTPSLQRAAVSSFRRRRWESCL